MRIELTTSGGLTGRGIGAAVIDRDRIVTGAGGRVLTTREKDALADAISRLPAFPSRLRGSNSADAIVYILTIDGQSWRWTDADSGNEQLMEVADLLMAIRDS